MTSRVYVLTRDLLFRSKLDAIVARAGATTTRTPTDCGLAVVDLTSPDWESVARNLRARAIPMLAFGSHVDVESLRRARGLGAEAVPNSEVERRLTERLGG